MEKRMHLGKVWDEAKGVRGGGEAKGVHGFQVP